MNVIPLHSVFHHFYLEVDLSAKLSWSYHRLQWRRTGPLLPLDATFNPAQWVLKASPTVTLVHPCLEHARNVRPPLWLNTATGSVEPLDLFCLLNNLSRHSLEPRRKIVTVKLRSMSQTTLHAPPALYVLIMANVSLKLATIVILTSITFLRELWWKGTLFLPLCLINLLWSLTSCDWFHVLLWIF